MKLPLAQWKALCECRLLFLTRMPASRSTVFIQVSAVCLALIVLSAALAPTLWYQGVSQQVKSEMKHRLKEGVPVSSLVLFEMPLTEFGKDNAERRWEHAGEFVVNGRFYDVVYRDTCGTMIQLLCIADTAETVLFANLSRAVSGTMAGLAADESSPPVKVFFLLRFLLLMAESTQCILPNHELGHLVLFAKATQAATSVFQPPALV